MTYMRRLADGTLVELPQGSAQLGDLGWSVKTPASPEGHEVLTRSALGSGTITFTVSGSPLRRTLSKAEQEEIIAGNRSVDLGWAYTGLLFSLNKNEQKRHALRREYGQPVPAALADIVASLRSQHAGILAETDNMKQLHKVGQALHLVQDSFSPAHTDRNKGAGWCISYVKNFGRGSAPREHAKPSDDRDQVANPGSRDAAAEARKASGAYLQIVFKAIYGRRRSDPVAAREADAELTSFINNILRRC